MDKHVTIKVPRDEELKDIGIKQFYHKVKKEEKLGKLYALFDTLNSRVRMNRQLCEHKAGCQVAHTRCQRQGLHCLGKPWRYEPAWQGHCHPGILGWIILYSHRH